MKPELTVMRDRYGRGWPSHEGGERVYACSLETALTREYSSDAHFAAYAAPMLRRLTSGAVGSTEITMHVIVFDVDDPTTHGTLEAASDEWREEQSARCRRLENEHPGAFFYDTRGGYRCVYRLREPSVICDPQAAAEWRQEYAVIREYLLRRFDISVDPACSDWTRLFRLPHATRDRESGPERRLAYGDPCNSRAPKPFDLSDITKTSEEASTTTRRRHVLIEETIQKLIAMKMPSMAEATREVLQSSPNHQMSFEEKLGLVVDREWSDRDNRRIARRLKEAKLGVGASLEAIDCDATRGLDKALVRQLMTCQWAKQKQNVIITGATGTGKSFMASALAEAVCRQGMRAFFVRVPRIVEELAVARVRTATRLGRRSGTP